MSSVYPYTDRYDVLRGMPSEGRPRDAIREQLSQLAAEEDQAWESGQCSGTMYCGDHEHYDFMGEVYKLFAHVNVLQRDICPDATKFEGEIIAMTLDMLHGDDVIDTEPGGLVTSGGSDSILRPMYAYASTRGSTARSPPRTSSRPRPDTPPSTRPATSWASSSGWRRSTR